MSYNRESEFNITRLAQGWKDGTYDGEAGFILLNSNESQNKAICSSEFSTASKKPRVVITYDMNVHFQSAYVNIEVGTTKQLSVSTNMVDSDITFWSSDTSVVYVNENGLAYAKKTGKAIVTATINDVSTSCEVFVFFPTGDYYIENQQTGCYAGIYEYDFGENETVIQAELDASYLQEWQFTSLGEGYYSIKLNVAASNTSYYLGVINNSTSVNVAVVLRTGSLTDGMKWKIEETEVGAYKIIPKTGEASDYVLATTTSNATDGASLQQGAYVGNNGSYRDEWMICKMNYCSNIIHYYDEGFKVLFEHYNQDSEFIIRKYHNEVDKMFMGIFGLHLSFEIHLYTSEADRCKKAQYQNITYERLVGECPHSILNKHALTIDGLEIGGLGGNTITSIAIWTGHILPENPTSVSRDSAHTVVITPRRLTDASNNFKPFSLLEIEKAYVEVLMHELSHQIGTPDHSCYDPTSENKCNNPDCDRCCKGYKHIRECVTGDATNFWEKTGEEKYCDDCIVIIESHLNGHHNIFY